MIRALRRAGETLVAGGMALVAVLVIEDKVRAFWPASRWLEVRSLHVYDGWAGESPYMHVLRYIHLPFSGEWTATVVDVKSSTTKEVCPPAYGRTAYRVAARLPPDLTLSWWREGKPCDLPPGRYRLVTEWRITAEGWPEKVLRVESNIFEIHALPEAIKALRRQSPARSGSSP